MNLKIYSHGRYSINPNISDPLAIEKWIKEKQFANYEKDEFHLGYKSRKRNTLYSFKNKISDQYLVMKVSEISQNYKFWRKVDLFLTSLYKDYNYNSYRGSIDLQNAGVDTVMPMAYWTMKKTIFNRKSYFLYEKIASDTNVTQLCSALSTSSNPHKNKLINIIINRCINIVKKIHTANIRHGDPHGGNILTSLNADYVNDLDEEKLSNAHFILIDNDRCTSARSSPIFLKKFLDIKCLARFNVGDVSQSDLLKLYFEDDYKNYWHAVLSFWLRGGFNIKNQIHSLIN